jgi:hypothetical protein
MTTAGVVFAAGLAADLRALARDAPVFARGFAVADFAALVFFVAMNTAPFPRSFRFVKHYRKNLNKSSDSPKRIGAPRRVRQKHASVL